MSQNLSTADLFQKIIHQQEEARRFGFDWENLEQVMEQINSECQEIKEAITSQNRLRIQEEAGDVIHAAISLCIFLQLDPLEALNSSVQTFQKRYDVMVPLVQNDGLPDLKQQSTALLLSYWHKAKEIVKNTLAFNG